MFDIVTTLAYIGIICAGVVTTICCVGPCVREEGCLRSCGQLPISEQHREHTLNMNFRRVDTQLATREIQKMVEIINYIKRMTVSKNPLARGESPVKITWDDDGSIVVQADYDVIGGGNKWEWTSDDDKALEKAVKIAEDLQLHIQVETGRIWTNDEDRAVQFEKELLQEREYERNPRLRGLHERRDNIKRLEKGLAYLRSRNMAKTHFYLEAAGGDDALAKVLEGDDRGTGELTMDPEEYAKEQERSHRLTAEDYADQAPSHFAPSFLGMTNRKKKHRSKSKGRD